MTSGSTQGITDDGPPTEHLLDVPSIFGLLPGGSSRSLEESMPSSCCATNSGDYAVRHNPQAYYVNLGADCSQYNIPLADPPDLSSQFTLVTPNLIHDMHNGTIAGGDSWLSAFLPKVLSSPQYAGDRMAVFVTWDEDDNSPETTSSLWSSLHPWFPERRSPRGSTTTRCSARRRRYSGSARCSATRPPPPTCVPPSTYDAVAIGGAEPAQPSTIAQRLAGESPRANVQIQHRLSRPSLCISPNAAAVGVRRLPTPNRTR